MALLYGSLRSHIPLQFLKGKRSVSDHILETLNYIRHLRSGIQVLSEKRDELKRMTELKGNRTEPSVLLYDSWDVVVSSPCVEGVEVMINTSCGQGIPPPRILQVMMRGGLNVISFNSACINGRVIYSIRAEVGSPGDVNLPEYTISAADNTTDIAISPLIHRSGGPFAIAIAIPAPARSLLSLLPRTPSSVVVFLR
ncbi:hypothetical protein MLD38_039103 [Melastoma candidum]|uniref:Uncharacterized protein n=1 Tax=Melastoma candidum TaxID=119954 RepID=A0ACB9L1R5_9MYRT|nr:hypothetical protein MLD38_039103 [Melastoma candidum]